MTNSNGISPNYNNCNGTYSINPIFIACNEDEEDFNTDWVMVYSSSTCKWSHPRALEVNDVDSHPPVEMRLPLLIKSSLYFALDENEVGVLTFCLETNEFFLIDLPPPVLNEDEGLGSALMVTALDGGFGYATVEDNRLLIWSLQENENEPPEWICCKMIDMDPIIPSIPPFLTGSIEGTSSLFLSSADRVFIFYFNTLEIKEIGNNSKKVTPFIRYITPKSDVQESDIDDAPTDQACLVPAVPCLGLFWGEEVKPRTRVSCKPGGGHVLHLSQVALGETKKGCENVVVCVEVNDKKLVLGTLSI